jgi:hypothetical protein
VQPTKTAAAAFSAVVSRTGDQAEPTGLQPEPSLFATAKVRRDLRKRDDLSDLAISPLHVMRPRPCAGPHRAPSDEPVKVQLQPLLKTNPLARSWQMFSDTSDTLLAPRSESGRADILRSQKHDYGG